MDLSFLKNDIPNNLGPQEPVVYSITFKASQSQIRYGYHTNSTSWYLDLIADINGLGL